MAQSLVDEGARVCIIARKPEALNEAVEALGRSEHAIAVPGIVDDPAHQEEAIECTLQAFGRIDVVNNAGIHPGCENVLDLDLATGRKILEESPLGTPDWTQHAYRGWTGENGGAVVNIESAAGLKPAEGIGFTEESKVTVMRVTQQLAVEFGPTVRANGVAPAAVKTQFATIFVEGKEQEVTDQYATHRLGYPEDVAATFAFLGSADAGWITRQALVVVGGLTLGGGV